MDQDKHITQVNGSVGSADISLDLVDFSVEDKPLGEPATTDLLEGLSSLNHKSNQENDEDFDLPPPPPPSLLPECGPKEADLATAVTIDDLLGGDLVETDLPPPPPSLLPVAAEAVLPPPPEVCVPLLSGSLDPMPILRPEAEKATNDVPVSDSLIDVMMLASDDFLGPSEENSGLASTGPGVMSSDNFLMCDDAAVHSKGESEPLSPKTDDSGFEPEASPTETQAASGMHDHEELTGISQQDQSEPAEEDEGMIVSSLKQNEEQEDDFEFEVPSPEQHEIDPDNVNLNQPIPNEEDLRRLEEAGAELVATALTSAVMMCRAEPNPDSDSIPVDIEDDVKVEFDEAIIEVNDPTKTSSLEQVNVEFEDISPSKKESDETILTENFTLVSRTEVTVETGDQLKEDQSSDSNKDNSTEDYKVTEKDPMVLLQANGLVSGTANESPTDDDIQKTSELQAAEDEWAQVETVTPEFDKDGTGKVGKPVEARGTPVVSFNEALQFCQGADMQQYQGQVKVSVSRGGFAAFKHALFGPPKLHRDLHNERLLAFCIAACPFNNDEPMHLRVLQTIYKKLTGSKFDSPRFGGHWEQIGFQGQDPATDLRGTGFLGLMQLLYFVSDPRTLPIARDVYRLSRHETQNFPFCIMGINISRLAIQAMREDCLNKECNRRKQVLEVMNDFYVGAYFHLYTIWKHQHKTIADSGFVIKEVETYAKKSSRALLKNLDSHIQQRAAQSMSGNDGAAGEPVNFATMADLEDDDN